jgi:antitoxin component of MazEF toxin-antitoxin module
MRKKVIRVGTSAAVTISPSDLRALGISVGDPVEVTTTNGGIEIRPVSERPQMSHDALMSLVDEKFGV